MWASTPASGIGSRMNALRLFLGLLVFCLVAAPGSVLADEMPRDLSLKLLVKAIPFDRNFAARATPVAKIFVVAPDSVEGALRDANALVASLRTLPDLGGAPVSAEVVTLSGAALRARCEADKPAVVIVARSLTSAAVTALVQSLAGLPLVTAASEGEQVRQGVVLGFHIVEGRPKPLINVASARDHGVEFATSLLKLADVVR